MRAELFLTALSLLVSEPALASPRLVRAAIDTCAEGPVPLPALERVLPLELESAGLRLSQSSTAAEFILTIQAFHCGPEGADLTLAALELASGRGSSRTIHLRPGPASPRIVAVAIAELARDLLAPHPALGPSPTTMTSSAPPRLSNTGTVAVPAPLPLGLRLALGVDSYPGASAALLALDLGLEVPLDEAWILEAGATLRYGAEQDLRGTVDLGAIAPTLAIHLQQRQGSLRFQAGPRLVLGWAFAAGRPKDQAFLGKRVDSLLGELWIDAAVSWTIAPGWRLGARGGAGYVLSSLAAQAEGTNLTGMDGAALGFSLFLGRDI
ncbi:MAG: hypothetical protein U1E65_16750 [Myxococcota bacterium]